MSKKDYSDYSKMPVRVKRKDTDVLENPWFDDFIFKNDIGLSFKKSYVVEITKKNSDIIEKHIKENESYNANFTKKIYEYHILKNNNSFPLVGEEAKGPLTDLIRMIDLENSTNIWRYKSKRHYIKNMVKYISDNANDFWDKLNNGNKQLVDLLKKASGCKENSNGPKSLASKICKYFCELFFEDKSKQDNYFINDSVVRHVLPYYLNFYGIPLQKGKTNFDNLSYVDIYDYLSSIRDKINKDKKKKDQLTRSEVDHIMWYCYRYEGTQQEE